MALFARCSLAELLLFRFSELKALSLLGYFSCRLRRNLYRLRFGGDRDSLKRRLRQSPAITESFQIRQAHLETLLLFQPIDNRAKGPPICPSAADFIQKRIQLTAPILHGLVGLGQVRSHLLLHGGAPYRIRTPMRTRMRTRARTATRSKRHSGTAKHRHEVLRGLLLNNST